MLRLSRCLESNLRMGLMLGLVLLLAFALPVWAQETTGTINGSVVDQQGAAVAGATVTATDVERGVNTAATTDGQGLYNIPKLIVGRYTVTAEKSGFKKAKYSEFRLVLNQVAQVNLTLEAGATSQEIVVTGEAPLLQTGSTELSTIVDNRATENIPLANRNYGQLTLLTVGSVNTNPGSFTGPQTTFQTGRPYINGNREQTNEYLLDGMENVNHDNDDVAYSPSVDAIQEFNLITQNAPADFGNYAGGIVSVSTKSGTNQWHGSAFEFLRNTIFNANEWQNNLVGKNLAGDENVHRNQVHWNEFGGTLGGPIVKDKLFLFVDYQGNMFHTGTGSQAAVLTQAQRNGDFSASVFCPGGFVAGLCQGPGQLYQPSPGNAPAARPAFLNNQIPTGIMDPAAKALFSSKYYPLPSGVPGQPNAFNYHTAYKNDGNQGDIKVDYRPSQRDGIFFRFSIMKQDNPTTPSFALANTGVTDFQYPLQNGVLDWNRTITPSLINDVRVGLSHFPINQAYVSPQGQNFPSLFGISSPSTLFPGINAGVLNGGNINFKLSGVGQGFNLGNVASQFNKFEDSEAQLNEGVTWTHGKHEVHAGFQWNHYRDIFFYPGNEGVAGELDFGPVFTSNGTPGTGAGEADMILGLPNALGIGQNCPTCAAGVNTTRHVSNNLFAGFVQDNWRLTTKLTVNAGLRIEDTTPRKFYDNTAVNWGLFTGVPQISGVTTHDQALYNNYFGAASFQPRLGLAYQLRKSTVIRAAFGLSSFSETNGVNNLASQNPPSTISHQLKYSATANYPGSTLTQGFSGFAAAGGCTVAGLQTYSAGCYSGVTLHVTSPNLRPEVNRQWNFSIQQQLGNSTTFQIGYTGQSSYRLANIINLAQPKFDAAGNSTPSAFLNPTILAFGGQKRFNTDNSISNYHALQAVMQQRLAHGLQAQLNFTWGKCLADSPGYFGIYGDNYGLSQSFGGWAFPQDTYNQKGDYGLCNYDVRADFNGYVLYELPFGRGRQFANNMGKVVDGIVGGWSVDTDFTFHSGMPWDLLASNFSSAIGSSFAPRPDCLPGVPKHLSFQPVSAAVQTAIGAPAYQWLNPLSVTGNQQALYPGQKPYRTTGNNFGNCPVDSHTGLGLKTADLGLSKTFHITERQNIEFKANAINFTNTTIFALPAGGGYWGGQLNSGSAAFGTVSASEGARQLQFALKYHF